MVKDWDFIFNLTKLHGTTERLWHFIYLQCTPIYYHYVHAKRFNYLKEIKIFKMINAKKKHIY